jgi:TRAP-type C4-dicarboxylate transport system permease small subunit
MRRALLRVLEVVSVALVTGLILVTCIDVIGRYLFDRPFAAAFELTQVMLGALVFAALPITTARGGHVEVDLLVSLLSERAAAMLGRIAGVVSGLVLFWFAIRVAQLTDSQIAAGSRTPGVGMYLWPLGVAGTLSCAITGIIAMARKP